MVTINGTHFQDALGRTIMFRGINLSGSSKIPAKPALPTHNWHNLYSKDISFVSRPFPLSAADEHFGRLKSWGFNLLRLIITWEAIEPKKPKLYDEEYLEYLYQVVKRAGDYDLKVLIDPHQDVWSRFTGGDGAPQWTLEKVGFDVRQFAEAKAAILHQNLREDYPEMIWATNYAKLACASMFTLFFGGNDFAPNTKVEDTSIQEYLQNHYFEAIKQVVKKVKNLDNVLGYDTLNEPSAGWIGWKDLKSNKAFPLMKGVCTSPFEAITLGYGIPQEVEVWDTGAKGAKLKKRIDANSKGIKVWLNGHTCIWKDNGVWEINSENVPTLLKPKHFCEVRGQRVDFTQDYLVPFMRKFADTVQEIHPNAIIFGETPPTSRNFPDFKDNMPRNFAFAPHWYDITTLFTKKFRAWLTYDWLGEKLVWGKKKVLNTFTSQLKEKKEKSPVPVVIGEIGIPYDMHKKSAYRTGNFKKQIKALDASLKAVEANLLNICIWNYTPDNSNEHGDLWNKEDLSIFSKDQQSNPSDINSGGRALEALLRPYPRFTAGKPLMMKFDVKTKIFEYRFEHDETLQEATEIYIPNFQYPKGYKVEVSDGEYKQKVEEQLLVYHYSVERYTHTIKIFPL